MNVRRIAMWSGPRNISTAMMRAWENRADCAVVDEPLYGAWLATGGADHPGRETVLAAMETDWRKVVRALTETAPDGVAIWYQKHMAHHLLPGMAWDWIERLDNILLIRDPAEVIASWQARSTLRGADDLGFATQLRLYQHLAGRGAPPPVIDARDVLENPRATLETLCARLGIAFDAAMLRWPAGKRTSDGVWAPWWYDAVEASTGFAPWRAREVRLDGEAAAIEAACRPIYETLYARRLRRD